MCTAEQEFVQKFFDFSLEESEVCMIMISIFYCREVFYTFYYGTVSLSL